MHYPYLHGFASGPQSVKAQFLQYQFAELGQTLHILDLNQGGFTQLTLSRQIQQGLEWMQGRSPVSGHYPGFQLWRTDGRLDGSTGPNVSLYR